MQMRPRFLAVLATVFGVMAALVTGSAASAHLNPAGRSAVVDRMAPARTTAMDRPYSARTALTGDCDNLAVCGLQVYYDIYGDYCAVESSNSPNWGSCRNQDEGLYEWRYSIVRIYYSPNYAGAWACLPAFEAYFDLNQSDETFDNGAGRPGYGQQVWENVASSAFGTGSCSNPMPGGQYLPP